MQIALALAAFLALIAGLWGGIYRIGWLVPPLAPELPGIHGPLIVCGFLGTLFGLDRAFSLKTPWAYLSPAIIAIGSFLLFQWPVEPMAPALIFIGSLGFSLICFLVQSRQPNLYNLMIFVGSLHWLAGILIWFSQWPVYNIYAWWIGFVLFTIVGQRLELAHRIKLEQPPFIWLKIALAVVILGEIIMVIGHFSGPDSVIDVHIDAINDPRLTWGMRVTGVGIFAAALWLLIFDAAWSLLAGRGMAKYAAICLISGYIWLAVTGALSIMFAGLVSGVRYDALIHAFFLGFLWFVIFGHGPILVLSSLGCRVEPSLFLYVPVVALHGSLVIRIIGDMLRDIEMKKIGGAGNGMALLLFFAALLYGYLKSKKGTHHV
jgi:hypothetical protein